MTIVVVGSVNMDLVATTEKFPRPGETLLGQHFSTVAGGKGSNQAIAAARAGADVAFVGAVGTDLFGGRLREALESAGVDTGRLRVAAGSSGVALITVDSHGENTIVVVPGANGEITQLQDADIELIRSASLLLCQLEIPLPLVLQAVSCAKAAGVPVMLNLSPARSLPDELVAATTIAVVNSGEARAIGTSVLNEIPHVITTLGGEGAEYRDQQGVTTAVPSPGVTPVDTTGAGDAFAGNVAAAWARGLDPLTAVRRGCVAGALATTVPGASSSSPTAAQVDELMARAYL